MARSTSTSKAPRRVIGYVRISKDRDDETSTTTQEQAIEAWCTLRGHQLVKVVIEPGRSAYKASRTSRPGFREASQLVNTGAGDLLAVWKVDRACRNTLDLLQLVQELERNGAEFASVTEEFDTSTPMGKTMLTIVGALAEMESAQKSDRATEWHRHRRTTGAVPAGKAALGYRKPEPNTLEPDPVVAPLVAQAAAAIADGASVRSQVVMLNEAGVKITQRGFTTALMSPTMIGMVVVSDEVLPRRGGARVLDGAELVPGEWEPIIDREVWETVRAILHDPRRRIGLAGNHLKHSLAPIARCHCGGTMRVHYDKWSTKTGTHSMRRLMCNDCTCGIGYDAVEEAVVASVLDLLDDDVWHQLRARAQVGTSDDDGAAAQAVEAKLERMWQMVLDGKLDPDEYAEAKARWRGEVAAATTDPVELPDVADVRAAWPEFAPTEKYLVLKAAISRLVIGPTKKRGGRGVDLSRVDLDLVA